MIRFGKTAKVFLITITVIVAFSLLVFFLKILLLPILPQYFQTWITAYVAAGLLTITLFAGFAQITGYSLKDFVSKNDNLPNTTLTQIDGMHKAKGEGEITGLDIQAPVIIKPGTKSTAEGKGKITATRISNNQEKK